MSLLEGFKSPITRRGLFSEDDFFQGFQKDYDVAIDDVLNRWGSKASKADRFASYRRLREREATEDTLAATISDTPEAYMITVDMQDYAAGSITVETVQFSVVIEGKCGSKHYKKQFPLPKDTNIDRVTADLSDENIMIVTAPKKGKGVAISTQTASKPVSSQPVPSDLMASLEAEIIPIDSQTTSAGIPISMAIEGEDGTCLATAATKTEAIQTSAAAVKTEALQSSERKSSTSRVIPLNIEGETANAAAASSTSSTQTASSTSERIIPTRISDQQTIYNIPSPFQNRVLPITKRGKFFQDSTFESAWKDFESAIDDMVTRKGSTAGMENTTGRDKFQSYRNLRKVVQKDDNQAGTVSSDGNGYKIVLDVKDFVDGFLDVKSVKGLVCVIGKKGNASFERKFAIPGLTKPEEVNAALSTDGVLTITAPF